VVRGGLDRLRARDLLGDERLPRGLLGPSHPLRLVLGAGKVAINGRHRLEVVEGDPTLLFLLPDVSSGPGAGRVPGEQRVLCPDGLGGKFALLLVLPHGQDPGGVGRLGGAGLLRRRALLHADGLAGRGGHGAEGVGPPGDGQAAFLVFELHGPQRIPEAVPLLSGQLRPGLGGPADPGLRDPAGRLTEPVGLLVEGLAGAHRPGHLAGGLLGLADGRASAPQEVPLEGFGHLGRS
jgi:hypothetical protein